MKKQIKNISLLSLLLLTFGITDLNFENLNFDENTKAYICLSLGILLAFIAAWSHFKNKA